MQLPSNEAKAAIATVFGNAAALYGQGGGSYFSLFGRKLVEYTQLASGMQVLDIATGRGASLFPAAQAVGATGFVTGIDLSGPMVAATNAEIANRDVPNAAVRVMDAEQLDFPDETFDAEICGFALFFMPQPKSALVEFHRVLRRAGKLGISTWGKDDSRWQWYDDLLDRYAPALPRLHTSSDFDQADKVGAVIDQAGYRLVRVVEETITHRYASREEWWETRWSHFGRRRLEHMPEETLAAFKSEVFTHLAPMETAGELRSDMQVLYSMAEKQ